MWLCLYCLYGVWTSESLKKGVDEVWLHINQNPPQGFWDGFFTYAVVVVIYSLYILPFAYLFFARLLWPKEK